MQHTILSPLNQKLLGPLDRTSSTSSDDRLTTLPFVFCLGNHSSGKSTFINYVLGRDVQTTGVAPTDDGFTIIAPGDDDVDQDGPTLVGDPDLGFSGLRSFGPSLIQRTQLKVRSEIKTTQFMFVDSPGMIDSPTKKIDIRTAGSSSGRVVSQLEFSDRGYDFQHVIRWFAERADVILLFFDPDKPGTTGETLQILTSALVGMDHKLHIVLNKVDQFRKIHDFARAYGSLCWNLSKVIPRKDLPRIYTMCIPVQQTAEGDRTTEKGLGFALADLESTRNELINEVMKAPDRRIDNVVTRLDDSVRLIQMHAMVFETIRQQYSREKWARRATFAGLVLGGGTLATGSFLVGAPWHLSGALGVMTAGVALGVSYQSSKGLNSVKETLLSEAGLSGIMGRHYGRQIAEGDEYVLSLWKRVMPRMRLSIEAIGFDSLPKVKQAELDSLIQMLKHDIPELRREAAPSSKSFAHKVASLFRRE